jgi:diazepam-binding inhibitor (GABA receptor modulating acyl-CoA-binding protein)
MTEKFEKAIELVKKLKQVNDEDKLILYSYYKQAKFGDINIEKPSILNRVEMEKWKGWNNVKGMSKEDAMKNYVKKVKELLKNSL